MLFFALNGSELLGRRIAGAGRFAIDPHEEREFSGGEHKSRPLVSVRGRDDFVLHALQGGLGASVNDRLIRLLLFLAACRENGAARVTAIVPYLAYSRKDRQTKPRDPVTTRYVAQLFEAAGADVVMTLDVHNLMAFQNAFRCRTLHLATDRLFAADIAARAGARQLAVVSPDAGGSSAPNSSARRWKWRRAAAWNSDSWKSGAAPAWSRARISRARSRAGRSSSSTT
jgi:ribose-phosphate pyrophosphokinase